MDKIFIKRDTLTDIADALRRRHGETKLGTGDNPLVIVSKTPNATSFTTYDGPYPNGSRLYDVITIPGASTIKVKMAYQSEYANEGVQVAAGNITSMPSEVKRYYGSYLEIPQVELEFSNTDTITFYFKSDNSNNNFLGYYAECTGYTAEGELIYAVEEVPNTYNPLDMAAAIDDISAVVESINITENGTYTPEEDVDGFNEIIVNVPAVVESIVITKNGKYTPNEGVDGFNEVDVNVADIPAVVEAITITNNGIYTPNEGVDGFNKITVNVAGGGGGSLPEEAFNMTGDCQHRFSYGGWDWFVRDYGNQIITNKVDGADYMFYLSNVVSIPFDINMNTSKSYHNISCTFDSAQKLTNAPRIINAKPQNLNRLFYACLNLREIPESFCDTWDWSYMKKQTSGYSCNKSSMICYCQSLRKFPMSLFSYANPQTVPSYAQYSGFAQHCYVLDEIVNLPIPYIATWTSNSFSYFCYDAHRLKDLTFETNADGTPKVMNWKAQTIDLSQNVGQSTYNSSSSADEWNETSLNAAISNAKTTNFNSGITKDKAIYTAETYAALKDDPDAFCMNSKADGGGRYSRYTHRSAVATINSLPDTSAYLASAGGTNTIKFLGNSGSATDEGAISNLTAEEIAVAAAKGWTVSLV